MKVLVEFGSYPEGPLPEAVWIIDTPENRTWFERQVDHIDANSAVFRDDSDPLSIIWNVFEHHPTWTEVEVQGAALTPEIELDVKPEAYCQRLTGDGFKLRRAE